MADILYDQQRFVEEDLSYTMMARGQRMTTAAAQECGTCENV
jgi:hypothetical protein